MISRLDAFTVDSKRLDRVVKRVGDDVAAVAAEHVAGFFRPACHQLVKLKRIQFAGVDAIVFEGLLVEVGDAVLSERITITVEIRFPDVQPCGLVG